MQFKEISKNIFAFIKELFTIYTEKRISRSAAELAYFLTLSIFPTLICVYAIVSHFLPGISLDMVTLEGIIPAEIAMVIDDFLAYVSTHNSRAMVVAGIIGMASSSAAAFRSIHNVMGDIQGKARYTGLFKLLFSFVFSLLFLAAIYFAALVMVTGDWLIRAVVSFFPESLSGLNFWMLLKFPLLLVIFTFIIYGIYRLTAPKNVKGYFLLGSFVAAIVIVVVSVVFSEFMSISTKYSLIYGPLVSIIIFMLWIYIIGNILIMSNAINFLLRERNAGKMNQFPIITEDEKKELE